MHIYALAWMPSAAEEIGNPASLSRLRLPNAESALEARLVAIVGHGLHIAHSGASMYQLGTGRLTGLWTNGCARLDEEDEPAYDPSIPSNCGIEVSSSPVRVIEALS